MPENALDPDVVNLTKAIRKTESNDNFTARGASGEFGAYQYTPDTWNGVAKKYGINVPLEQASPRQQNEVTYRRVKEWKDAGYNVGQIASMWNAGEGRPNAYKENFRGVNKFGVQYDTPAYATKVATAYQGIKSTQQPSQALGETIGQGVETTDPFRRVAQGQAAFPSQQDDSIGTSLLKTAANLPGSTYNLARNVVAPVNPFDRENPLNIGQNIYESGVALKDIYRNRGAIQGTKDIVKGFANTISKGVNFVDDLASGAFRMTQERGLGGALAEGGGRLAQATINDPTLVPSLLYSPRALGGRDLISDVASPVTKPIARVGEAISERADDATVAKREAALKEVDQANNARVAAEAANPERWSAARRSAAESDVLTKPGVINDDGKIVGAVQAAKAFKAKEIGDADKVVAKLLERERVGIPLEVVEREITRTVREALEGAELMTALNKIKREMVGLRLKHKDGIIQLKDVHRLKVKTQPLSKDYLRPQSARYNKQLARGYKETIERYSKENIKEINAEIQKYLDTADYIAGLQGKFVDSGKLGKMVARAGGAVTGAIVGGAMGGIPGVIGGSIAGGAVSSKLAARSAKKTFGKPTKRPSKPNKVLTEAIKRATEDRKQLALPAPKPKKPLALPPGNKYGQNGPNIKLGPARSMEKGVEKPPFLDSLDVKVLKKMVDEPLPIPDELKKYLNITDDVEEVSVKAKNELPDELEGKLVALQIQKEALDSHPAKSLSKFVAKRGEFKGQLGEEGKTKGGFGIDERISESTQGAYDTVEEAREGYLDYIKQKERFATESKKVMAEIKEYKAKNKKPGKARELLNAAKANLKNPQLRQGGYALNKPKVIGEQVSKVQKSSSLNSTPQKLGVANPAQNLADAKQGLKEAKGLSPSDIVAKSPDINMKRDTPVTDVYGKKSIIPAGEALTPYELKGNKVLLQDGETYIVSKNQWQNVKGQSVTNEAKPFAPELAQTEEVVLGLNRKGDKAEIYKQWENGKLTESEYLKKAKEIDASYTEKPTKYSSYTLPNGENYREILIQAPVKKGDISSAQKALDELEKDGITLEDEMDGNSYPIKDGEVVEYDELTPRQQQLLNTVTGNAEDTQSLRQNIAGNATYKSSHWDEPNVLAHLRLNDRTYNGKKVTFMEELQSDWAREGRDKGFIQNIPKPTLPEGMKMTYNGDTWKVVDKDGKLVPNKLTGEGDAYAGTEDIALARAIGDDSFIKSKNGVPNNPLLKNWQEMSVKRALLDAVYNDSKYFSWINGDQTSARYKLSKEINNVEWNKATPLREGASLKRISLKPKQGNEITLSIDDSGIIKETAQGDWKGKKLDEVLGKGLADSIMSKESGTLAGEGLNFGGEWAKNLYDKQVADIVRKLTGAEVKKIDLGLDLVNKEDLKLNLGRSGGFAKLTPDKIKVGVEIQQGQGSKYIITDVLGDGKFKAIPNSLKDSYKQMGYTEDTWVKSVVRNNPELQETFDISNPTQLQQAIELTPEVVARIKGQAVPLKPASGRLPFKPEPLKAA